MNRLVVRMTSKELCDLINVFRQEEGNNTVKEHKDLMKSIRTELDALASAGIEDEGNFSLVTYIDSKGEKRPCYSLTEEAVMQMLNKESAVVRYKTQQYIKSLKKQLAGQTLDFNRVFGKYRLRKSIREAQDIRQLFEDYIRLSAIERTAGRLSNKERIYALNAFTDEIQILIANEATSMRGSELLALQELLTDVSKEKTRLSNKANGGFKSNMTRKIKQLEDEIAVTQEDIDFYDGSFYCINRHSYTANRLTDVKDGRKVKAAGYKIWLSKLNLPDFLPETMTDVDFTKKLRLTLGFISVQTMDLDNQIKAIQDALAEYYDFDDIQIDDLRAKRIDTVDSYEEGKIYVKIENMF